MIRSISVYVLLMYISRSYLLLKGLIIVLPNINVIPNYRITMLFLRFLCRSGTPGSKDLKNSYDASTFGRATVPLKNRDSLVLLPYAWGQQLPVHLVLHNKMAAMLSDRLKSDLRQGLHNRLSIHRLQLRQPGHL